jgi:hypothetical protein
LPNCCDAELRTMVVAAINIQYENDGCDLQKAVEAIRPPKTCPQDAGAGPVVRPGPKECCDRCKRRARRDRYK